MNDDVRQHIVSAVRPSTAAGRMMGAWLTGRCWPGGAEDRFSAPSARWLAGWQPEKLGAPLPACSCSAGHCAICN